MLTGQFILLMSVFIALFLHEMAHYRVAIGRGYRIDSMLLMPYGAVLSGRLRMERWSALAVYLAGPAINALFAVITVALWWMIPSAYPYTMPFMASNLALALFNILPLYPLDGAMIIIGAAKNRVKALAIMKAVGITVSSVLFVLFLISFLYEFNLTLGIISLFLFTGAVSGTEGESYYHLAGSVPFIKDAMGGMTVKEIIISADTPLVKLLKYLKPDTVNVFKVVDKNLNPIATVTERELEDIYMNFDILTPIGRAIGRL